jgi:hypothetical protein
VEIVEHWMSEMGYLDESAPAEQRHGAAAWCEQVLGASWPILRDALFVRSCVFSESSCVPVSMADAVWVGEKKDGLADWDPAAADALVASEENVRTILDRSDAALRRAEALAGVLAGGHLSVSPEGAGALGSAWDLLVRYVSQYRLAVQGVFLTRYLLEQRARGDAPAEDLARRWSESIAGLGTLAEELQAFGAASELAYPVYMMLDPERLRTLAASLSAEASAP